MITFLKIISCGMIGFSVLLGISAVRIGQTKSPEEKEYELLEQAQWLQNYYQQKELKTKRH